jgi:hypothetical protein
MSDNKWFPVLLWLWVFVVMATYLYQFRRVANHILELLGLL